MTSTTQGGTTVSFAYDAAGRRHSRSAGGTTTRFLNGPGGVLLENQGANYTATYTHGNALIRKDSEYPLMDGIGSERTVTAANQSVGGTITFEGFGQSVATTGSSGNPYMFKGAWGYRNDGDAGLHHVGARYYDAQVGRFVTRDTLLSGHPYLYCEHDPINGADPSGHLAVDVNGAGGLVPRPPGVPAYTPPGYIDISIGLGTPFFIGVWGDLVIGEEISISSGAGLSNPGPPVFGWIWALGPVPIARLGMGRQWSIRPRISIRRRLRRRTGLSTSSSWRWV